MKKILLIPPWLLVAAAFSVLLFACRDWDSGGYVPKPPAGRVLEYGTETPIPDALVSIAACDGELGGTLNCSLLDTTRSDAQGRYAFDFTDDMAVLRVNAFKDGYFTDHTTAASVLDYSEQQTDILLPPFAWLEVTIRNESGAYAFNTDVFDSVNPYLYVSQGSDTTLTALVRGNQNYKFGYCIKPDPETLTGCDWVTKYCPGHDTTKLTIIY